MASALSTESNLTPRSLALWNAIDANDINKTKAALVSIPVQSLKICNGTRGAPLHNVLIWKKMDFMKEIFNRLSTMATKDALDVLRTHDDKGFTSLDYAAASFSPDQSSCFMNCLRTIQNSNRIFFYPDASKGTPFHKMIEQGKVEFCISVIDSLTKDREALTFLKQQNEDKDTPLHLAIRRNQREISFKIIEALKSIPSGKEVFLMKNIEGKTPAQFAHEMGFENVAQAIEEAACTSSQCYIS